MAEKAIHWLFPTPVLQADLTPPSDVALAMQQQLAVHVDAYLMELLGPNHALQVHIQKAWPVVCA